MSRVERIGSAVLYEGDCNDRLLEIQAEHGRMGALITDPPYGISADSNAAKKSGKNGWAERPATDWDSERPPPALIHQLIAMTGEQIIWGGNYFADLLPPTMRWLVWDKGQRDFSLADVELAWTSQQKAARCLTIPRSMIITDGRGHPTQKPVALMKWCLGFVPKAEVIFDPFMGSGSTGVAALAAGRSFVGVEREGVYFDMACERMAHCAAQGRLFEEAVA